MERFKRLFGIDQRPKSLPVTERPTEEEPVKRSHPSVKLDSPQAQEGSASETAESFKGRFLEFTNRMDKFGRRYIPMEEDDCLSCKVIGTSTMLTVAAYVFYHGNRTVKTMKTGQRLYRIQYTTFSLAFLVLGISRAFDTGVFTKRSTEEDQQLSYWRWMQSLFRKDMEKVGSIFQGKQSSDKDEKSD